MINDPKTKDLAISDIYRELKSMQTFIRGIDFIGAGVTPGGVTPVPVQAVTVIRNGSYSHSVGTWFNNATADDRRYECAFWSSHPDTANHPMHQIDTTNVAAAAKTFVDANVTVGTGNIAIAGHGFKATDAIQLTTTGVLPSAYALATTYYVIVVDANNVKLATSVANALAGTAITGGTAAGGGTHTVTPINYTLKSDDHAQYSALQSNWTRSDTPAGCARINQDFTLDAPLPQPVAEPGFTLYAVFNCAVANSDVFAPATARLTAGLYAFQSSKWEYLKGVFEVTASVSGTVTTPTSRDYVIHARTSRGFTIQTSVRTVAAAPSDADFGSPNNAVVVLSWRQPIAFGVLGYDVYRNTGGTYKLLERVETGLTSYVDNNSTLDDVVAGYPATDLTALAPFTATNNGVVANLAVDGVDANWDTIPFALKVPGNYNHGLTDFDSRQWLRFGLKGLNSSKFDIRFFGIQFANGSSNLFVAPDSTAVFTAGMVGKTIVLIDPTTDAEFTTTIATFVDPTNVTITSSSPYTTGGEGGTVVIQGASDSNVLYVDLAHLSFGPNATFSFHPDDLSSDRGTPAVAANGSNGGGIGPTGGGGGGGDGGPRCPWESEMVTVSDGAGSIFKKLAKDLVLGDYTIIGNRMGQVSHLEFAVADIYETITENGYKARTSLSHKYVTDSESRNPTKLERIGSGGAVLTNIEGQDVPTTLKSKKLVQKNGVVVKISLIHCHEYLIGSGPGKWGGIGSENRKQDDQEVFL